MATNHQKIRLAAAEERPVLEEIAREAFAKYLPRMDREPFPMLDDYAAHIAAGHAHVLEHNGEIAGYVILIPQDEGSLLLDNIAIKPDCQRKSLGSALLLYAEEYARENGCSSIHLYTNESMWENLSFYPRLGYREIRRATQNGYKRVFFEKSLF